MILPYILLAILWFGLIVYAAFGGADFGAGIWEFFASGATQEKERDLINEALGPVWEANHVWIVFLVVGLFSTFPVAFAIICAVLFVPLTLALVGIVLRGSAFIFRTHGLRKRPILAVWSRVFGLASVITPFFLGVCAAAVASGRIVVHGESAQVSLPGVWLTPFAWTIGFMAVSLCATIAAIYLTVEATSQNEHDLADGFRIRGLIAGAITAVLGLVGLLLAPQGAPIIWRGLLDHAIPLVIITMVLGIATAVTLYFGYYRIARALIVAETAFLLGTWGVSQIPYLIPPNLTVEAAAGAPSTLLLLLIGIIIGMILILPSIAYLFYIFKFKGSMGITSRGKVPMTDAAGTKLPALK